MMRESVKDSVWLHELGCAEDIDHLRDPDVAALVFQLTCPECGEPLDDCGHFE